LLWSLASAPAESGVVDVVRIKADGTHFSAEEVENLGLDATAFTVSAGAPVNLQLTNVGEFHFMAHDAIRTVIVDECLPADTRVAVDDRGQFHPLVVYVITSRHSSHQLRLVACASRIANS
jgi:hypothetical protein